MHDARKSWGELLLSVSARSREGVFADVVCQPRSVNSSCSFLRIKNRESNPRMAAERHSSPLLLESSYYRRRIMRFTLKSNYGILVRDSANILLDLIRNSSFRFADSIGINSTNTFDD